MKTLARIVLTLGLVLSTVLPSVAYAAFACGFDSNGNWACSFGSGPGFGPGGVVGIASTYLFLINSVLVPLLFAVAFIVFLYGIAKSYIFSGGDEESRSKGHKLVLWGIIGFVVMISLWGLVNVVSNTFGLGGYVAPLPPQSY